MLSLRSHDEQLIDSGAWKMQLAGQGVNGCLEVSHPPLPPGGWPPPHPAIPVSLTLLRPVLLPLFSKGHALQHLSTWLRARRPPFHCFSLN